MVWTGASDPLAVVLVEFLSTTCYSTVVARLFSLAGDYTTATPRGARMLAMLTMFIYATTATFVTTLRGDPDLYTDGADVKFLPLFLVVSNLLKGHAHRPVPSRRDRSSRLSSRCASRCAMPTANFSTPGGPSARPFGCGPVRTTPVAGLLGISATVVGNLGAQRPTGRPDGVPSPPPPPSSSSREPVRGGPLLFVLFALAVLGVHVVL